MLNTVENLTLVEDISFSVVTGLPLGVLAYDPEVEVPKDKLRTPFSESGRFEFLTDDDKLKLYLAVTDAVLLLFYRGKRIGDIEQELVARHHKSVDIEAYIGSLREIDVTLTSAH